MVKPDRCVVLDGDFGKDRSQSIRQARSSHWHKEKPWHRHWHRLKEYSPSAAMPRTSYRLRLIRTRRNKFSRAISAAAT